MDCSTFFTEHYCTVKTFLLALYRFPEAPSRLFVCSQLFFQRIRRALFYTYKQSYSHHQVSLQYQVLDAVSPEIVVGTAHGYEFFYSNGESIRVFIDVCWSVKDYPAPSVFLKS